MSMLSSHRYFPSTSNVFGVCLERRIWLLYGLTFRLTPPPYIFTKFLSPLVKYWRYNFVVYLDDGWGYGQDLETCDKNASFACETLSSAGFFS